MSHSVHALWWFYAIWWEWILVIYVYFWTMSALCHCYNNVFHIHHLSDFVIVCHFVAQQIYKHINICSSIIQLAMINNLHQTRTLWHKNISFNVYTITYISLPGSVHTSKWAMTSIWYHCLSWKLPIKGFWCENHT